MTDGRIANLVRTAEAAAEAGRIDDAERLWREVIGLAPQHPQALFRLGQHALFKGRLPEARDLLVQASQALPNDPSIFLSLATVFRKLGDPDSEMAALTRSLTISPYFYPALLAKGGLEERLGQRRRAAKTYGDLLSIVPPDEQVPAELKRPVAHARTVVQENTAALDAYLAKTLTETRQQFPDDRLSRFDECVDIAVGKKKAFTQQPTMLHFPGLPATSFYERADFPWLAPLEAQTSAIAEELAALLHAQSGSFEPYVRHPEGVPLNQWAELNHSPRWGAFFLWEEGKRRAENCALCPKTAAILETLPMADIPGFTPAAFFSALQPKTMIPAHVGVTNVRLIVHLPLIVPKGCWYRVGNETREWKVGEALIFDDTIEHQAWNGSDQTRVVLIFDIWNPYLNAAERQLVCKLLKGMHEYGQGDPLPPSAR